MNTHPRLIAEARVKQARLAGYRQPEVRVIQGEIIVRALKPCAQAFVDIPLEGEMPECGVTCGCAALNLRRPA